MSFLEMLKEEWNHKTGAVIILEGIAFFAVCAVILGALYLSVLIETGQF